MAVVARLVGGVVSMMEGKERTTLRRRLLQGSLQLKPMLLRVTRLFRGGFVEPIICHLVLKMGKGC